MGLCIKMHTLGVPMLLVDLKPTVAVLDLKKRVRISGCRVSVTSYKTVHILCCRASVTSHNKRVHVLCCRVFVTSYNKTVHIYAAGYL